MSSDNPQQPHVKPDFDQLANMLVEEGVFVVSPSELHGLLCGQLAAGARLEPLSMLQSVCELTDINALEQEDSKVALIQLYQVSEAELESAELGFQLLMPDEDDSTLAQLAEALGCWCQGFLAGFGLYSKQTDKSINADVSETLRDLAEIAQISPDIDDDEDSASDLMEIQEYVRMAALMVFAEFNSAPENKQGGAEDRLH